MPKGERILFQAKEDWPIKLVTVYEDRAQVSRILEFLPQNSGEVELSLEGLPPSMSSDTLRAEVETGNATLHEVSFDTKFKSKKPNESDQTPEERRLREIGELLRDLAQERARLQTKLDWLETFKSKAVPTKAPEVKEPTKTNDVFQAAVNPDNLDSFNQFLDFNDTEASKVDLRMVELDDEELKLSEEMAAIQRGMVSQGGAYGAYVSSAIVLLDIPDEVLKRKEFVIVKLVYVVTNASWKASYDVRVNKINEGNSEARTVSITYYGEVVNKTSEDWIDITMALSTAKPSRAGNLPKLPRLGVKLGAPIVISALESKGGKFKRRMKKKKVNIGFGAKSHYNNDMMADDAMSYAYEDDMDADEEVYYGDEEVVVDEAQEMEQIQDETTESESKGGSALFKLSRLATIEADNKPHKQKITVVELEPAFSYVMSPRVSPNCFLKCNTKNTSTFQFIPGPMAVFFEGSFVTKTQMKLVRTNETFSFYLGMDESVKLDYQPEVSKDETINGGFIFATSKSKMKTVSRTINIINTRNEDVKCLLYEQIPLSKDKNIKVEVVKPNLRNDKKYAVNSYNHLEARKVVEKNSTWTVKFEYKVEWPKDKEVEFTESLENIRQ